MDSLWDRHNSTRNRMFLKNKPSKDKLPPYRIRTDGRVKGVRVKVVEPGEIEIVVPRGFDKRRVPRIVADNMAVIEQTFHRVRAVTEQRKSREPIPLPQSIVCQALDTSWDVEYTHTDTPGRLRWREREGVVVFTGDVGNRKLVFNALRRWLLQTASEHLDPWLRRLSVEMGLSYVRTRIGMQKTRWGSCSSRGTIALNCNVLFWPPELVRHVMIHELAHTVHPDHSADFWAFVAKLDPDYKELRSDAKQGRHYIPAWVMTRE